MKKILLFLSLVLLCVAAIAQNRSSYDAAFFKSDDQEAAIEVGKGINITDPFTTTRPCFTSASRDAKLLKKQGTQGATTKVDVFYTKNEYEYNMFKSSNRSGSVSFLNMASLSASEIQKMTSSRNQVSEKLIFVGTVDFGNYFYPDEPTFTPEAQKLLDAGNYDAFKMRYGTHFVSGIGKASTVIVELTLDSDENNEDMSTDFGMDANLKYRADLNFKVSNSSEVSTRFKDNGFQVNITLQGPHLETESWEDAIIRLRNGGDLITSVSGYLKNQLQSMQNEQDALPVRYFFTDFTMYGCEGIKWNLAKEKKLSSINRNILECYNIINFAQENIDVNPIDNPKSIINAIVSNSGYKYDGLQKKAASLNPEWSALRASTNNLITKLQTQYTNCSDITCAINETCCGNTDYTEQVKDLFAKYNSINAKLLDYFEQWFEAVLEAENQREKYGNIVIHNESSNPYDIYVNGKYLRELGGKHKLTLKRKLGTYKIKAEQTSGYLFDPTINNRTVTLKYEGEDEHVSIGYED